MSFTQTDVLAAFDHFSRNWGEVQNSKSVGCSMCLAEFRPNEIVAAYKEEGGVAYERSASEAAPTDTVRCPKCGLPYVLGDGAGLPIAAQGYLSAVHQHWHT